MASFTETATLKVVDQASAEIKTINAALKALFKTAKQLKSTSANIEIKTKGLQQAGTMIGKIAKDAKALQGIAANINVKVNTTQAQQQLNALKRNAQQVGTQMRGAAARGRAARGRGATGDEDDEDRITRRGRRRPSASQYAHSAAQGVSTGLGLGIPLGGHPALMALEIAAYAAAAALKKVAEGAMARDRANLQMALGATPGQRRILEADAANKAKDRGPLPMTDTERRKLQTSLLGDVSGMTGEDRARAAVNVADYIEKEIIPRQFALNPGKSFDEIQEGARKLVQAMNLSSTDIVNKVDKFDLQGNLIGRRGELSQEGMRVAKGIQMAQAADPELQPQLIKRALASAKSLGFTANEDAMAKLLMNVGTRGERAATEAYAAQQGFTGTVKVKQFLENLAKYGLYKDFEREGKAQTVKAGSGHAVDAEGLMQNHYDWLEKNLKPKMIEELTAAGEKKYKKTGKESDRFVEDSAAGHAAMVEWIQRFTAGMSRGMKQGTIDALLGNEQADQQLRQAKDALQKNNMPEAMQKSWVAQLEKTKTALQNQADAMGDSAAKAMGLPEKLELLSKAIADPKGDAAKTLVKGALTGITDILKMSSLEVAAKALQGAGVDLTAAAYKLMGKEPPAQKGSSQALTDADVAEAKAGEETASTIAKKLANRRETLAKTKDSRERGNLENEIAVLAQQYEAQQQKIKDALKRINERQQNDLQAAAKAADISDEDPYIITEVANEKAKEDAQKRVMEKRQEAAKRDRALYERERRRLAKMTPAQRAREEARWRADKGKDAIVPYGPEAPAPKPEGPEKPPTPIPPVQDLNATVQTFKQAADTTNTAAGTMSTAVTNVGTASTNFATAFDTGSQKLAAAGKTAVSDMQAGAGGIGAAIAAAFVAGASGVKVGVDTSGIVSAGYKSPANKGNLPVSV